MSIDIQQDNVENKKKESRRSRSRSPLKKIEERTKKKLRERVDEVTKEVCSLNIKYQVFIKLEVVYVWMHFIMKKGVTNEDVQQC